MTFQPSSLRHNEYIRRLLLQPEGFQDNCACFIVFNVPSKQRLFILLREVERRVMVKTKTDLCHVSIEQPVPDRDEIAIL